MTRVTAQWLVFPSRDGLDCDRLKDAVEPGIHVLVGENNAAGKTRVLRAINGLGRVKEFGNILRVDNSRPKASHPPTHITDWKHDPVAKAIIDSRASSTCIAFALSQQSTSQQILLRISLGFEMIEPGLPGIWREPSPKTSIVSPDHRPRC